MASGTEQIPFPSDTMSFQSIGAPRRTSDTFNVPNAYRGVLFILDSTYANMCCFLLASTGVGVVHAKPIVSSEDVTVSTATNSLTFTHGNFGFNYFIINVNNKYLTSQ